MLVSAPGNYSEVLGLEGLAAGAGGSWRAGDDVEGGGSRIGIKIFGKWRGIGIVVYKRSESLI